MRIFSSVLATPLHDVCYTLNYYFSKYSYFIVYEVINKDAGQTAHMRRLICFLVVRMLEISFPHDEAQIL